MTYSKTTRVLLYNDSIRSLIGEWNDKREEHYYKRNNFREVFQPIWYETLENNSNLLHGKIHIRYSSN